MAGRNSIYEVFRACRLCGGGGGYKMPIVNLEDELDMRHKIRETVRIEVHQDDKMPPLICELCVDKVNDYFEFLEMCRATDSRTRRRLGLQQAPVSVLGADPGDCILGVTEPLFVNDDSNDEPLSRQKNKLIVGEKGRKTMAGPASKKSEATIPIISIKRTGPKDLKTGLKGLKIINGDEPGPSRIFRTGRHAPTPPPSPPARRPRRDDGNTRRSRGDEIHTRGSRGDEINTRRSLRDDSKDKGKGKLPEKRGKEPEKKGKEPEKKGKEAEKKSKEAEKRGREPEKKGKPDMKKSLPVSKPPTRFGKAKMPDDSLSLLKLKEKEKDRSSIKRTKEEEYKSPKRVKIAAKPERRPEKRRAASPPFKVEAKKPAPATHPCALCDTAFANAFRLNQHMKSSHSPTFTAEKLACDACGEWFVTLDEASTHHRWHRSHATYSCRLCSAEFKQYSGFNKHFLFKQCVPSSEVPDVKCEVCWSYFATKPLLDKHTCRGEDYRPGGTCWKCSRKYATQKTLRQHEITCFRVGPKSRKGGAVNISPELAGRLLPMKVRVARCDPVLARVKTEAHYNISDLKEGFDLVRSVSYPYISSVRSIKRELFDLDSVKHEMDFEDSLVHYESYTDSDSEPEYIQTIEQGEPKMVSNPFARKKKSIDALSTLSIKTIFSWQMLGRKKIQRKRKRRPITKLEVKDEEAKDAEDDDKDTSKENVDNGGNRTEGDFSEKVGDDFEDNADDARKTVDDYITGLVTVEGNEKSVDAISESENKDVVDVEESLEHDETVSKITDSEKQDTSKENGIADATESNMETDAPSSDIKSPENTVTKNVSFRIVRRSISDDQGTDKQENTDNPDKSLNLNEKHLFNNYGSDSQEKANQNDSDTSSNSDGAISHEKPSIVDSLLKPVENYSKLSREVEDTQEKAYKVENESRNLNKNESTLIARETGSQDRADESNNKSLNLTDTHHAGEKMHNIIYKKDNEKSKCLDVNSQNVPVCSGNINKHLDNPGNFEIENEKSIETTSIDVRLSDPKDDKICELENSESLQGNIKLSHDKPSVSVIVSAKSESNNHKHTSGAEASSELQLESSKEWENVEKASKDPDSESTAKKMDDDLLNDLDNISDTEMDDVELMKELDRQIDGDSRTEQRDAENNKDVKHNVQPEVRSENRTEEKCKVERSLDEKISLDELLLASGESSEKKVADNKVEPDLNFGA